MPITEIGSIYTPSIYGRTSFPLRHEGDPIFYKIFNAESSQTVILNQNQNINEPEKNIIYVPNHFFKTGEPLKYFSNISPIGITSTSPGASGITTLPGVVYPIVLDKDRIRVALGVTYATNNEYVYLNSLGIGTQHSFECFKQNSKCLVSINNIIQSPISIASTVKVLNYNESFLQVESLQNIKVGTCLRIGTEILRVSSVDYDLKKLNLSRGPTVLGTQIVPFTSSLIGSYIEVLSGNYNIIKDIIYFDDPPLEGKKISYTIPPSDIDFLTYSFNYRIDDLKTGDQVLVLWGNPPQEIGTESFYFVIKNKDNNFSFARSYVDAITGSKLGFSNLTLNFLEVSGFKIVSFKTTENSFNGRAFLRSNYQGNTVFDDVSEQFTGITSAFELRSSGVSTVGIRSDNGILLINNIFQYPGSNEAFSFVESGSSTNVNFVGFGTTGFLGKSYDVNVKGYPRGGIIVSYATTSGSKYQISTSFYNVPLTGSTSGIGASVSFETDQFGNVRNFKFTNKGYNYKIGEILVPLNTLGIGTQVQDDKLHIRIDQVTKDSFGAWNIGILEKLDDLTSKVDGSRKSFNLRKNGTRISLNSSPEFEIDFSYNLLVFINDILQVPKSSYVFNGGSLIVFTEPIPRGSTVKVYIYKGFEGDTSVGPSISKLKEGDLLRLEKDFYDGVPLQQNQRIIKEFVSADVLRTNVYTDIGISENSSQLRSVTWTPQKSDLILDGSYISKSREEYKCGVTSFTKVTSFVGIGSTAVGITTTEGTYIGFATNFIGLSTTVGIGSLISIGDYIESTYTGVGVSIVSIGTSSIGIAATLSQNISGVTTYSPAGITTTPISFYKINV